MTGLERLDDWPGEHRAAGWVRRDGSSEVAGDADRVLRLASVTKLLTATAILVATEEGIVALDEPAGPPGSTVRLLLAHASGLSFDGSVVIAVPGQRRIYGNAAFDVLGALLSERAGMEASAYIDEAVCRPLGMVSTTVPASPAHSGHSTVRDLLRFAAELLAPGTVIAPQTLAEAVTPQLPDLAGVLPGYGPQRPNDWGLGFELHGHKDPHWMPPTASASAFGHFGQTGSFLWVDPVAGVACAGLSAEPFGDWARQAWPALGVAVLEAASE